MKRTIFLTFVLVVALSASVALGDNDKVVQRVPAGAVAFHFLAQLTFPELVGYIAFIEGVQGDLFDGTPGVGTAYFTVRVDPDTWPDPNTDFIPLPVDPSLFTLLILPGAEFSVYFNETPNQVWGAFDTFYDGERVATFKESALLGTTITDNGTGFNLFSSRLIWSKSFWFNGQKVDFKKLVPNGVTINNVTRPMETGGSAFTASAIAIGGDHNF